RSSFPTSPGFPGKPPFALLDHTSLSDYFRRARCIMTRAARHTMNITTNTIPEQPQSNEQPCQHRPYGEEPSHNPSFHVPPTGFEPATVGLEVRCSIR